MPTAVPEALCLEMSLPHHVQICQLHVLNFLSELRVQLTPCRFGSVGSKVPSGRLDLRTDRAISHADAFRRPRDATARDASAPPPCGAGHGGGASPPSYSRIDAPCEPTNMRVRSGARATGSD